MPTVTKIPATKDKYTAIPINKPNKKRVAAYARVSTDNEEQLTSYEAQVDYYTRYIQSKPDWEFVKVYTDEGISATNTKHREGFKEMVEDALAGKIDLIVTKSVSRFARNTVDSLVTVRQLKEKGVEIYFEKENIYTLDSKGELLITIMSSIAQEESRSISENVTWGVRKRFSDGKFSIGYSHFLGYKRGEEGNMEIVEEEAQIVRLIYKLYLKGKSYGGICKELEKMKIKTPFGKDKWNYSTVRSILQNEKYKGDALLQKTFTVDFLQKKHRKNNGEVNQYYIENSHDYIIEPSEWELVQQEIQRRKGMGNAYSNTDIFAARLKCECCGGFYGKKVWHSTDKYRREIWQCNSKFNNKKKCDTPHLTTDEIKELFLKAYSEFVGDRKNIIDDCELLCRMCTDTEKLQEQLELETAQANMYADTTAKLIQENASRSMNQDSYNKRYEDLVQKYERSIGRCGKIEKEISERKGKETKIRMFIDRLKVSPNVLDEWDDTVWLGFIDEATVHKDYTLTFKFKNGAEITV